MLVPDPSEVTTVFDTLVYLAWSLFNAKAFVVRMMNGIGILVRNTFEHLVDYAIATKLSQVLSVNRMAFLCKLTEGKDRPKHIVPHYLSYNKINQTKCYKQSDITLQFGFHGSFRLYTPFCTLKPFFWWILIGC